MPRDNVIEFAPRRSKPAEASPRRSRMGLAISMQATPGCVRMVVGNTGDGAELWLEPDQADQLSVELARFARAARGLSPDRDPA